MIYAKPGINGNTRQDFFDAGHSLHIVDASLRLAIQRLMTDVFHGRNYQHLTFAKDARDRDILRLERLQAFLVELEKMQEDIVLATNSPAPAVEPEGGK